MHRFLFTLKLLFFLIQYITTKFRPKYFWSANRWKLTEMLKYGVCFSLEQRCLTLKMICWRTSVNGTGSGSWTRIVPLNGKFSIIRLEASVVSRRSFDRHVCGETPRSRRTVRLRLYVMEAAARKPQSLIDADVWRSERFPSGSTEQKLSSSIRHLNSLTKTENEPLLATKSVASQSFSWDTIVFPEQWPDVAEGRPRCVLGNLHAVLQPCINSKLLIGKCLKLWFLFRKGVCSFKCCSDI